MSLVLEGTVVKIGEMFEKGDFRKKEVLLRIDESSQYPQTIPIEVINNNLSILDPVGEGDRIRMDVNLRGTEWNGRNYVSIGGWRLSIAEKAAGGTVAAAPAQDERTELDIALDGGGDSPSDEAPF